MADARSILAILLLCAVAGMVVDVEISGEDEADVLCSITKVFGQEVLGDEGAPTSATAGVSTENSDA